MADTKIYNLEKLDKLAPPDNWRNYPEQVRAVIEEKLQQKDTYRELYAREFLLTASRLTGVFTALATTLNQSLICFHTDATNLRTTYLTTYSNEQFTELLSASIPTEGKPSKPQYPTCQSIITQSEQLNTALEIIISSCEKLPALDESLITAIWENDLKNQSTMNHLAQQLGQLNDEFFNLRELMEDWNNEFSAIKRLLNREIDYLELVAHYFLQDFAEITNDEKMQLIEKTVELYSEVEIVYLVIRHSEGEIIRDKNQVPKSTRNRKQLPLPQTMATFLLNRYDLQPILHHPMPKKI